MSKPHTYMSQERKVSMTSVKLSQPPQMQAARSGQYNRLFGLPLQYVLIAPTFLIVFGLLVYPLGYAIGLSFSNKILTGSVPFKWVGLENYIDLLAPNSEMWGSVWVTLRFALVGVFCEFVIGLGLALVLNQTFRFSRFVRAGLLLPWIVPTAISSLAWLMLFDSVLSPVSWVLKDWGVIQSNINFLGDRWNAISAICVANVWRGLPFFAISILAGLQAVAPELHEAAALDGANAWQRFVAVTLPTIRNIILITTLFSIIFTFSDFQLIYVLTKGGPASSTHVFGTYAYQTMGFSALGQAAAIALSMLPFLAIFAAILLREIRKED
ncbi:MAG: sugar ABC transporter permease [Thermomicrobiales bacterium]|nr:sugar ABC transporter permease [Thermomicrobiales bacterium]